MQVLDTLASTCVNVSFCKRMSKIVFDNCSLIMSSEVCIALLKFNGTLINQLFRRMKPLVPNLYNTELSKKHFCDFITKADICNFYKVEKKLIFCNLALI